jgi:hypothetical protein
LFNPASGLKDPIPFFAARRVGGVSTLTDRASRRNIGPACDRLEISVRAAFWQRVCAWAQLRSSLQACSGEIDTLMAEVL